MDKMRLGNVMVDCRNEQELCEFYHRLLGWEKVVFFGHPAVRSENGIIFLFVENADYIPPVWPEEENKQQKQLHFDFQVPNLPAAVRHAKSLGAIPAENQFGGEEYVTFFDPAGHPFCLCAEDNSPV